MITEKDCPRKPGERYEVYCGRVYEMMARREDILDPVPLPTGELRKGHNFRFDDGHQPPTEEWLDADFTDSPANDIAIASRSSG